MIPLLLKVFLSNNGNTQESRGKARLRANFCWRRESKGVVGLLKTMKNLLIKKKIEGEKVRCRNTGKSKFKYFSPYGHLKTQN